MRPSPAFPFNPSDLHVSFSQISSYLICPQRFDFQYVRGLPPAHRSSDLVFGSAVHAALADYHRVLAAGRKLPADEVTSQFDRSFADESSRPIPVLWADDGAPEKLSSLGRELVSKYVEKVDVHQVLAVEQAFSVPASERPPGFAFSEQLVGVVDLVERDANGATYITEFKTAAKKWDSTRIRYDLQLGVYAAIRSALGFPDARLRLRVFLKTKKPSIETYEPTRDASQIAEAGKVISLVLRAVDHGVFYPLRGWACSTCPYRSLCGE